MNKIAGKFTKVAETKNSIVVGLIGSINSENCKYDEILKIATFYGICTEPGIFAYHFITESGAIKRGCVLPTNNFNEFIEFFR